MPPAVSAPGGLLASRPGGLEGITLIDIAGIEPGAEPPDPLGRGAVSEGLRRDAAPRLLLEPVIANGRRCREAGLDVAGIQQIPLLGVVPQIPARPVGLQLDEDRERIAPRFGHAAALLRHLPRDAELVLHVMTYLVRDHVGARELSRRPNRLERSSKKDRSR